MLIAQWILEITDILFFAPAPKPKIVPTALYQITLRYANLYMKQIAYTNIFKCDLQKKKHGAFLS